MTKQLITIGSAVLTTLLSILLLWQFRSVVVYVLISLTVAAALRPLIKRLPRQGFVVRLAWILLYVVVLAGVGFIFVMTIETAAKEIQQLAQSVSGQDEWKLPLWWERNSLQQTLVAQLPPPAKLFEAITGDQGQLVLPTLLGFTQGFFDIFSGTLIVLFLSIYWITNQVHFERLWLSLLASGQRKQAREVWRTIEPDLGAYIRSQVLHSLLAGLLLGLGYWALGSPYPAFLALAGALASLVPMIGLALAIIPVLLLGMMTSVQLSLFAAVYTLVVMIALGVWVKPRLFNRQWDNPILTLVLLIALASAFGLIGIIIAPPLSAVIQILWRLQISHRLAAGAAAQVSDLKERQEHIWTSIKEMDEPPVLLLTSSMERLTHLMEKAEPLLQAALPVEPVERVLPIVSQPVQENSNGRAQNS